MQDSKRAFQDYKQKYITQPGEIKEKKGSHITVWLCSPGMNLTRLMMHSKPRYFISSLIPPPSVHTSHKSVTSRMQQKRKHSFLSPWIPGPQHPKNFVTNLLLEDLRSLHRVRPELLWKHVNVRSYSDTASLSQVVKTMCRCFGSWQ